MKFLSISLICYALLIASIHLYSADPHAYVYGSSSSSENILLGDPSPDGGIQPFSANNPYGMIVVPQSHGDLHKNDLLVSGWNGHDNNFFGKHKA
jgi:hypothetical protein